MEASSVSHGRSAVDSPTRDIIFIGAVKMKRQDLERFLEKDNELGFVNETEDPRFLGWILLQKRKPHERYLSLLAEGEEPEFVAEQETLRRFPYQVHVIELDRQVFESGRYETEEDYRINEIHRFSSLDEVEGFVQKLGHSLEDIKWRIDIDAP
jgi:hypothetical protein